MLKYLFYNLYATHMFTMAISRRGYDKIEMKY